MNKKQEFSFSFSDNLLAEVGGVPKDALHFDVNAICRAYESIKPIAKRLGVSPPKPRLAGFCYPHVASLGTKIIFPENSEPNVIPLIKNHKQIDKLREPKNYLQADLIKKRLYTLEKLKKKCPDAQNSIGHLFEGPVTTAVLLMGSAFFTLPYDDTKRAHRLLEFCVNSAFNYAKSIKNYLGEPLYPGHRGFPDDFAGVFSPALFEEFVVPYWEQLYQCLQSTERSLHSELLRVGHMNFLKKLRIEYYDPGADQYLTAELLKKHCPSKFQLRIQSWHIYNLSADKLKAIYRQLAQSEPNIITFSMDRLADEQKILNLLELARKMRKE